MNSTVVGAVEPLAAVGIGHRSLAATGRQPAHPTIAVLARDEQPLPVERETVAATFLAIATGAGKPRRFEKHAQVLARLPTVHTVVGNIREEQVPLRLHPHRPLRPGEAAGEHLDRRVLRQEPVDPRIDSFDRTNPGQQIRAASFPECAGEARQNAVTATTAKQRRCMGHSAETKGSDSKTEPLRSVANGG